MDRYNEDEIDPVFRTVVNHWMTKIVNAKDHKKKVFQTSADECLSFYSGPRSWDDVMGGEGGVSNKDDVVDSTFKVNVNKTFEFVTIFGPALYYENPVRTVKKPPARARERFLTKEERRRIFDRYPEGDCFRDFLFAMEQTGCRPGEVAAMAVIRKPLLCSR